MKGLHLGSYWMAENDIVYLMAQNLKFVAPEAEIIDVGIYFKDKDGVVRSKEENEFFVSVPGGGLAPLRILRTHKIIELVSNLDLDFVVCNAGGLVFDDKLFDYFKKRKIVTVGISLSDPDVFNNNGAKYAHKFDLFLTNSLFSCENQYDHKNVNIKLMPFAACTSKHFPMANIKKEYDVVVVGHARPERVAAVSELQKYCNVGLYGMGWKNSLGVVNGEDHNVAINKGKIYLSFGKTMAGHQNVKVGLFEALACKTVVITEHLKEVERYFRFGLDLLPYKGQGGLCATVRSILRNEKRHSWIAQNSYSKLISEHTWAHRWTDVLSEVARLK